MDDQQFEMMMQMHRDTHDKIDTAVSVVKEAQDLLKEHIKDDERVYKVVERHTTYWKMMTGGLTVVMSWLGLTK